MASIGALRTFGAPAPLTLGVRPTRRSTVPIFERASASDVPALSELLDVLFTQEVEFKPDTAAQCKGLSTIIGNPDLGAILVATAHPYPRQWHK